MVFPDAAFLLFYHWNLHLCIPTHSIGDKSYLINLMNYSFIKSILKVLWSNVFLLLLIGLNIFKYKFCAHSSLFSNIFLIYVTIYRRLGLENCSKTVFFARLQHNRRARMTFTWRVLSLNYIHVPEENWDLYINYLNSSYLVI